MTQSSLLLAAQIHKNMRFSFMARLVFAVVHRIRCLCLPPKAIRFYAVEKQRFIFVCRRALFWRERCFCSLWILNTTLWSWLSGHTQHVDLTSARPFINFIFTFLRVARNARRWRCENNGRRVRRRKAKIVCGTKLPSHTSFYIDRNWYFWLILQPL